MRIYETLLHTEGLIEVCSGFVTATDTYNVQQTNCEAADLRKPNAPRSEGVQHTHTASLRKPFDRLVGRHSKSPTSRRSTPIAHSDYRGHSPNVGVFDRRATNTKCPGFQRCEIALQPLRPTRRSALEESDISPINPPSPTPAIADIHPTSGSSTADLRKPNAPQIGGEKSPCNRCERLVGRHSKSPTSARSTPSPIPVIAATQPNVGVFDRRPTNTYGSGLGGLIPARVLPQKAVLQAASDRINSRPSNLSLKTNNDLNISKKNNPPPHFRLLEC
jgi:hypothetical protein